MIPRAERLPVRNERRKPLSVYRTKYFTLKVFRADTPKSRFAFIVGKVVAKASTKRNRLRRVVARLMRETYANKRVADVLVIALPPAGRVLEQELVEDLKKALVSSLST